MTDYSDYRLGETADGTLQLKTREENAAAALELTRQCRLKLAIFSHELEPVIYDRPEYIEALKRLTLGSSHVEIRILVTEPRLIVQRGHRLPDLALKLSSYIQILRPGAAHRTFDQALLLADEAGYLLRTNKDEFSARLDFNNRRESRRLLEIFDEMWGKAGSDPNLRRMRL